ncbi:Topoisomerase DNA binding C4 zinc finger [Rubripirellula obstinata]|uniref:Topoisomerase DNA binding C4 zinc finger n=1 Tax=Rubripirellula obstinata TaxID=406547 RepID=A0A5B1CE20_9BACT|nr:DUF2726 domain-containing protein [Rubripirellula obstinata]KAA1258019.1 Topoisomerase DNA binding C4 zinc finger [Rubripirellula obstinata]
MVNKPERTGCLGFFLKLLGIGPGAGSGKGRNDLPYRQRDNFLSAAELAFYRVLEQAVGETYSINNKVRLWDVLYVPRRDDSRTYENKISSKHIDFLLCEPSTMQPVLAIELDDASHNRKDRQERDAFLDQALTAAGLAILHIKAARTYSIAEVGQQIASVLPGTASNMSVAPPLPTNSNVPSCPKCHTAMVGRKAAKGAHAGKRFWACTNYPKCREIIGID